MSSKSLWEGFASVGAQYNLPSRIKEQVPSLVEGKVPNFTQAQAELAQVNRTSNVQVTPARA
ncbi:MAG: hypothetical protein WDM89_07445 [Rhizomicrobium sp.]